ncbi:hypothetical protein ACSMX9_08685 [Streptomyces sp. LE64]|uniref:hypothetical protein n=1 Tax=Streptomyces sp. LE64 TaxID=3448653 RepID=UPI00404159D0
MTPPQPPQPPHPSRPGRRPRPGVPLLAVTALLVALSAPWALAPAPAGAHAPRADAGPPLPLPAGFPSATARPETFPLTARLHVPTGHRAGGPATDWTLVVTNRTGTALRSVHPVVVLTDTRRALRPAHLRLELHDGHRWWPTRTEATAHDENVVVPDDDYPGLTVDAHAALTVRARLALTADAPRDTVTAGVVLVRRDGDDGTWVGEAPPYAFRVGAPDAPPGTPAPTDRTTPAPSPPQDTGPPAGRDPAAPDRAGSATAPAPVDGTRPAPHELATTGQRASALVAAAAALLLTGVALYLTVRHRHPPRS